VKTLEVRQQREYERQELIRRAVEAADRIIVDGSDGTVEETNFLTASVAEKLMNRALLPFHSDMLRRDLED